jgi:hypothetical protein
MADIDVSIFEEASAAEWYDVLVGDTRSISVYDTVVITESKTVNRVYNISKYETVTVADVPSLYVVPGFYIDERYPPTWPVWELTAEFARSFEGGTDLYWPSFSIEAGFGGILESRTPTWSMSASFVSPGEWMSLSENMPTWEGEGYFGASLEARMPFYSITIELGTEGYFSLSESIPFWEIEGEIIPPLIFSLDEYLPFWTIEISLDGEDYMSLDESTPFYRIEATIRADYPFTLEENMPFWEIVSTMYSGDFSLDAVMPIWLMGGIRGEGVFDGVMIDSERFDDYILRYRRP